MSNLFQEIYIVQPKAPLQSVRSMHLFKLFEKDSPSPVRRKARIGLLELLKKIEYPEIVKHIHPVYFFLILSFALTQLLRLDNNNKKLIIHLLISFSYAINTLLEVHKR